MFDQIALLTGAAIYAAGEKPRRVERKPYKEPEILCEGCKHHYSFHLHGDSCHHLDCRCTKYSGIKPYIEPEI